MRRHSTLLASVAAALLGCLISGAFLSLTSAADTRAGAQRARIGPELTGIYESCEMPAKGQGQPRSCEQRLRMISEGGFQLVLNYNTASMSVADNLAYAELASSAGLKLAWNLSSYRMPIESKLELVRATRDHPATWGYYTGDEVRPEERDQVEQLTRAVRGLTGKPLLYISRPRRHLLRPFRAVADFVGPDSYPVGPFDPPVCESARWARRMVEGHPRRSEPTGTRLAMVVQAFSWSVDFPEAEHPWPSATRMRQMRDAAIRCGNPSLLLWFCFHCIAAYHPDPESYWQEVVSAVNAPWPRRKA